jgi:hypothetical protein
MSDQQTPNWERRLQAYAADFPYPPTPDIATGVARQLSRRAGPGASRYRLLILRLALAVFILLLASLSVSSVRAAILEFLQIGAVRIFNQPPPTETATSRPPAGILRPATLAPAATPAFLASISDISGETTLENARQKSGFAIPLPAYPAGLGPPDHVYLQESGDAFVALVWMDPAAPQRVLLSLHIIGPKSWMIRKYQPQVFQETSFAGHPAVWTEGPYPLIMENGEVELHRLVTGHVFIWQDHGLTYRLESDYPLDEAKKIAESLY